MHTVFAPEKVVARCAGTSLGHAVTGYQIHHGRVVPDAGEPFVEIGAVVDGVSDGGGTAVLRLAVRQWLWGMDGAILDWLDSTRVERAQVRDLLLASFAGALGAASQVDPSVRLALG